MREATGCSFHSLDGRWRPSPHRSGRTRRPPLHKPRGHLCPLQSYCHDVRTNAENGRFALHLPDRREQALALNRVSPKTIKIASQPSRAFDRQYLEDLKSSSLDFAGQFAGPVEESVGEVHRVPCGIPMLAILQIAIEDGCKLRIIEESVSQRIE